MNLFVEILRRFWLELLAFAVFLVAISQFLTIARWQATVGPMALASFGFLSVVASDEVADCTGGYGFSRQTYRCLPVDAVRLIGAFALALATTLLLFE